MSARYQKLCKSGELLKRVGLAYEALRECHLCPRECGVNRLKEELGFCRTGKAIKMASANSHFGEEPPISGSRGSGTIFFTSCNMRCIFCQNYPISQLGHGKETTPHELAAHMLRLQKEGCHNINLVTPSHVVPQFLAALYIAAENGLSIPIVYNSCGYDGLRALKILSGTIDIYLPDLKYASNEMSFKYSGTSNYCEHAKAAIKEMHRQVGDLKMDSYGIAKTGLLIRHLVLPNNISGSEKILEFIAEEISKKTYLSLMSQYFPAHNALSDPIMKRRVTKKEFAQAEKKFHDLGFHNGWIQKL